MQSNNQAEMKMNKYYAAATRKNVSGRPDYPWFAAYANGSRIQFVSKDSALDYARTACDQKQHGLYAPKAVPVEA